MTAATATASTKRGAFVRMVPRTLRGPLAAIGLLAIIVQRVVAARHRRPALAPLVVDESLRLDESVLDHDQWIAWARRNLSPHELELMELAAAADQGRPLPRVPASC